MSKSRKVANIIFATILIVGTIIGGAMPIARNSVASNIPKIPIINVDDKTSFSPHTEWNYPYLFGLNFYTYRAQPKPNDPQYHFTDKNTVEIILPDGYADFSQKITVAKTIGDTIFEGTLNEFESYIFPENNSYVVNLNLKKERVGNEEFGEFQYSFNITVDVPPPPPPDLEMLISTSTVVQGDTIAIELANAPEGITPTIESDLATTPFMPIGERKWTAYIGIADSHEIGDFQATVTIGNTIKVIPITVIAGEFKRQDLTINTSDPVISEANSSEAYKEYRETIPLFYETTDPNLYWDGSFIMPTKGRISSIYGLLRYTNGRSVPRRHSGIDIATEQGTPIVAPANGKVVFSDYLLNTGNTMVIEHGGGLKTYYFHMIERVAQTNDTVMQGDLIGNVGTTGYSTGPHLHFEIRIGNQNLDPFKFFEGTGGCFATKSKITIN